MFLRRTGAIKGREAVVTDEEVQELANLVNSALKPAGNLSAAELARKAGVAENTLAKMRRREPVSLSRAEKVRAALGAAPVVEALENVPDEIDTVQKVVAMWLLGMPPEARSRAAFRLMRFMGEPEDQPPDGRSASTEYRHLSDTRQ